MTYGWVINCGYYKNASDKTIKVICVDGPEGKPPVLGHNIDPRFPDIMQTFNHDGEFMGDIDGISKMIKQVRDKLNLVEWIGKELNEKK